MKHPRGQHVEMTREEYIQLSDSCDFLEHYHLFHSDDKITRFRSNKKEGEAYRCE